MSGHDVALLARQEPRLQVWAVGQWSVGRWLDSTNFSFFPCEFYFIFYFFPPRHKMIPNTWRALLAPLPTDLKCMHSVAPTQCRQRQPLRRTAASSRCSDVPLHLCTSSHSRTRKVTRRRREKKLKNTRHVVSSLAPLFTRGVDGLGGAGGQAHLDAVTALDVATRCCFRSRTLHTIMNENIRRQA